MNRKPRLFAIQKQLTNFYELDNGILSLTINQTYYPSQNAEDTSDFRTNSLKLKNNKKLVGQL